ncbi:MAG: hypothetical protein ACYTG0_35300 [Planctomycetota bacterium]
MRTMILSLAIGILFANGVLAQDCCGPPACCDRTHECCHRCGVQKRCKVVCEMKTVKTSCWVVECEEFCPSLPNCGGWCKSSCGDCCDDGCGIDHCAKLLKPMVPPRCGKLRSRKILTKKDITCEVPVYKCVVVCCNPGCCEPSCWGEEAAPAQESPSDAPTLPPPPTLRTSHLRNLRLAR